MNAVKPRQLEVPDAGALAPVARRELGTLSLGRDLNPRHVLPLEVVRVTAAHSRPDRGLLGQAILPMCTWWLGTV